MTRLELTNDVVVPTLESIVKLFSIKGDEYAVKSAFHNFTEASKDARTEQNPVQALEGMLAKHKISIKDILNQFDADYEQLKSTGNCNYTSAITKEKIDEKFNDFLVYHILMKAMLLDFYDLTK